MGWRWRHRLTVAALLLFAAGGAFGADLDGATRAEIGDLPALKGFGVDAADLADRPVIVVFFASWCVPCRQGFVELRQVVETAPEVKVVALNWLEDVGHYPAEDGRLQRMIDRIAPGIGVLKGTEDLAEAFGGITALPAVFAFSGSGEEVFRFVYGGTGPQVHPTATELLTVLETAGAGG